MRQAFCVEERAGREDLESSAPWSGMFCALATKIRGSATRPGSFLAERAASFGSILRLGVELMCSQGQPLPFGGVVIPISLPYIYSLSSGLQPLYLIQVDTPLKDSIHILYRAESALNGFLTQSVYSSSLKATVAPGMALLTAIKKLTTEADKDRNFDFLDTYSLSSGLGEFETVLTAEMNVGHAFLVTKKRGFDTSDLINHAEVIFPPEMQSVVPEAIEDMRAAGRCIAFDLGTAAGFHVMRATELILRRYFDRVAPGLDRPKTNNIGDYLRILDDSDKGEKKTRATLRQIKDLHRNELIHPEVSLTLDQAIALLGIAQSAAVAMLNEMQTQGSLPLPNSAPPDALPRVIE